MRCIIDAQLPSLLCQILNELGFDSEHIETLQHGDESSDSEIIEYADKNDMTVISKDTDFFHSHILYKKPRKLLLITTGNIKNRKLFDLFRENYKVILDLFKTVNFIELNSEGLIIHE